MSYYYEQLEKSMAREKERACEHHAIRAAALRQSDCPVDRLSGLVGAACGSVESYLRGHVPPFSSPAWTGGGGENAREARMVAQAFNLADCDRREFLITDYTICVIGGIGRWWWSLTPEGSQKVRRWVEDRLREDDSNTIRAAALLDISW